MRKPIPFVLCLVCACAAAWAQSSAISLANQEGSWFYFALDPRELEGLGAADPLLPGKLAGFFAKETDDFPFSVLKPYSNIRLEGLSLGAHLLVGFFVEDDPEFPVRVIQLQVDAAMGERFYAVYAQPAILEAPRGVGRLVQFAVEPQSAVPPPAPSGAPSPATGAASEGALEATLAQPEAQAAGTASAEESQSAPQAAGKSIPPEFSPATFTREKDGVSSVIPIAQSLFWGQQATRISEIRGTMGDGVLTLSLSVSSAFSERVSYFLYLFDPRSPGALNTFTLELAPRVKGNRSFSLLWTRGENMPRILGTARTSGARCEVTIILQEVPADLASGLGEGFSFYLTSCMFDPATRTYEEFGFGTYSLSEIVSAPPQ